MERRALLRALAVAGLAGCTPTRPAGPHGDAAVPDGDLAVPDSPVAPAPPIPSPEPAPADADGPDAPDADADAAGADASVGGPRVRPAIGRDALGLPAAGPGGREHTVTGLMLHHTAAPTTTAAEAPDRFLGHARHHRESGFVDIAYHWGVDVDGNVYELRDPGVAGETFTSYDPAGWLLVVCEGDFETSTPTPAMLDAVADVLAAASATHGVAPSTLVGHRDRAATVCPGSGLQDRLDGLVAATEQRLAAGGVSLRPSDDPAAVAHIRGA